MTIDTLRADHLGSYGYSLARTPRLDRLAEEGIRCANAVTAAPITLPSHATILTGLLPPAHGVRDNGNYALGDGATTLAERLKTAGYRTQAFVSAIILDRRYGLAQGFDGYDDDLYAEDAPKLFMVRDRPASKTSALASSWLDAWAHESPRRPFFLWVHFYDPHQPYAPPGWARAITATPYDGEIAAADRGVGVLLDRLESLGIASSTLVLVTADHGESLGEHGEKTHALFIYDATVRVPMIFRDPGFLPEGRTYPGPVRTMDIVPTILDALGLPGGSETQGFDLLPALRGEVDPPSLAQYSESLLAEVGFGMAPLFGLRTQGFKWIRAPKPELYDLALDPRELRNLDTAEPRRAAALDRELDAVLAESRTHAVAAVESPMDRETLENLRALGYLAPKGARESFGGMDPKDGIAMYDELEDARHLAQRSRWSEAESKLRDLLAKLPANVSARNVLGLVLTRQGRFEEATATYARSLSDDPKQPRVVGALATIALAQGKLDDAKTLCRRALALAPGFVEAMSTLGFVYALQGETGEAQRWYRAAETADPAFPRAWRRSADLYFERGDWAKALADYERAIERKADDFEAVLQAGASARRLGRPADAERWLRRAIVLRPDSWLPHYNLACFEAVSGHADAALAELRDAIARGFASPRLLAEDSDLSGLRPLAEFRALAHEVDSRRLTSDEPDEGE